MGRIKNFNQHVNEGPANSTNNDSLRTLKHIIKGDKEVAEQAKKMVGDGKDPNLFFVTASNDYAFYMDDEITFYSDNFPKAPVKIEDHIETETFGPFDNFKDAMKKADELDLSETAGPRFVMIEDRKTGTIYEKFLKAEVKVVWGEELNDDTKQFGYRK